MRTGKSCIDGSDVDVVQKPLRGHDVFFGGYVHDVLVARELENGRVCQIEELGFAKKSN